MLHLAGDATEDAVLERAGVRRARGLIATTANDATNMYIVLSARVLNPSLRIVARAADETSVPKLLRAGRRPRHQSLRHRRASPGAPDPEPGGRRLLRDGAQARPRGAGDRGRRAPSGSGAIGRTLEALSVRQATGASVLAVLREGAPIPNPPPDLTLAAGDRLLALGTGDQLERLEKLIASS